MPQNSVINNFIAGFPGMNADSSDSGDNYITAISGETTLQIPFGRVVMRGARDKLCTNIGAGAGTNPRIMLGVVAYNAFNQINSQLGNVADANGNLGLMPGAPVRIKQRGRLYVPITENVDPTLAVRVSLDVTGGGAGGYGTFRTTASGGHTVDISKFAKWMATFTSAQGFAVVEYDFRLSALATAD